MRKRRWVLWLMIWAVGTGLAQQGGLVTVRRAEVLFGESVEVYITQASEEMGYINLEGNFVAASQVCSHQQTDQVRFISSQGGIFQCSTHGSQFNQSGTPLNTVTSNPLKVFNTELNGDILRVFE